MESHNNSLWVHMGLVYGDLLMALYPVLRNIQKDKHTVSLDWI